MTVLLKKVYKKIKIKLLNVMKKKVLRYELNSKTLVRSILSLLVSLLIPAVIAITIVAL